MLERSKIDFARNQYMSFLESLSDDDLFRFTSASEITPYARCFAIFGFHLLQCDERLSVSADSLSSAIRKDLDLFRDKRKFSGACLKFDKPYLQLLAFSLSALSVLNRLKDDPLENHVLPILSHNIAGDLQTVGALKGIAGSGNQAMFMAIMLRHSQDYLGIDVTHRIDDWQMIHLKSMNKNGFWGPANSMSHLQFQNGYHQYELMDFFGTANVPWSQAADNVAMLADKEGHFAPYPGGGGCYDYDAVYMLTSGRVEPVMRHKKLLLCTAQSILAEQNVDGGFCESHKVRPRSFDNLFQSVNHVVASRGIARTERVRYAITLLRPKHNRIHTHWSKYSRRWNESDLWDSWFRMLTIARIDVALDANRISEWGFINYPGIGFHPLMRNM